MASSLSGIDVLVFTAGIGENSPEVREATCGRLGFLGINIDHEKNHSVQSNADLSAFDSRVRILKIRAQEDWAIAQECLGLTQKSAL